MRHVTVRTWNGILQFLISSRIPFPALRGGKGDFFVRLPGRAVISHDLQAAGLHFIRLMQIDNHSFFADVEKILEEGHTVTIKAQGRSMYPFILDGTDHVVLHRPRTVRTGDIVLARTDGQGYVLHRVYKTGNGGFVLMGDGNIRATERCGRDGIIGKVSAIIRDGKFIDCTSAPERAKAWVWRWMRPLRRGLLFVVRKLHN